MTPPSPAAGTEEGGTSRKSFAKRTTWEEVRADSEWALFAWKRMRCRWCPWEGTRFMLIQHWLEAHNGEVARKARPRDSSSLLPVPALW